MGRELSKLPQISVDTKDDLLDLYLLVVETKQASHCGRPSVSPHTDTHITETFERSTYIPMHSFKEAVVNSLLQWNDSPGRASVASCTSGSQGWSSEHWTQFRNNDIFSNVVESNLIF